jgi:hypothetical protein
MCTAPGNQNVAPAFTSDLDTSRLLFMSELQHLSLPTDESTQCHAVTDDETSAMLKLLTPRHGLECCGELHRRVRVGVRSWVVKMEVQLSNA